MCHGNNLSGGFANPTTPNEPVNYTGGLYSADLFLEHVIPEIESSPTFKEGGLIDVTFDEGFPPFTYSGNSFANSGVVAPDAATSIEDDSAAETDTGRSVTGAGIPAGAFVGQVTDTPVTATAPNQSGGFVDTGPETPEQGRFPAPASSPCTFVVTFAHISGVIPIGAAAFTFIDERGHVRHPRVTAMKGGAPPRQILPGRPVSLRVYDVLPTGDGGLTWAPAGKRPIVSWDFDVEID